MARKHKRVTVRIKKTMNKDFNPDKQSKYAKKPREQLRGVFRPTSPFYQEAE